jgi:hypothetical protein
VSGDDYDELTRLAGLGDREAFDREWNRQANASMDHDSLWLPAGYDHHLKRAREEREDKLLRLKVEAAEYEAEERRSAANPKRRGPPPGQPKKGDVKLAAQLLLAKRKALKAGGDPDDPAHSIRAIAKKTGVDRYWITKWWKSMQSK